MAPFKSPGPDGYAPCFHQDYWSIMGDKVVEAILDFLNSDIFYKEMNKTNLVLILKLDRPKTWCFRPIS